MKCADRNIVFIVDGGNKIGMGHVYQAMSLAALLSEYGNVTFLTKSDNRVVGKLLSKGFHVIKEINDKGILDCVYEIKPEIVIIDKIDVSEWLAQKIKKLTNTKLVIFTNLTEANKYADIVVTADIGSSFKNICYTDEITHTKYYYGPRYWVLRKEFYNHVKKSEGSLNSIKKILLIFGGSDPSNIITPVLEVLLNGYDFLSVDAIVGLAFEHDNMLNETIKKHELLNKKIYLHRDAPNVAELMRDADLVIASPGLSAFEALYVGTPILLIPQDALQEETYKGHFKIIEKINIEKSLLQHIIDRDFTFPSQREIVGMDIGGGINDLMKEIIRG